MVGVYVHKTRSKLVYVGNEGEGAEVETTKGF